MQLDLETMAARVHQEIEVRDLQGYDVDGLLDEWERVKGERELLLALHDRLKSLLQRGGYEAAVLTRIGGLGGIAVLCLMTPIATRRWVAEPTVPSSTGRVQ